MVAGGVVIDGRAAGPFLADSGGPGVATRKHAAEARPVPKAVHVLDMRQAAAYMGVSDDWLKKRAKEGTVPAFKIGREWRFRRARLDEWMDGGGEGAQA